MQLPSIVIVEGVNASGKNTFIDKFVEEYGYMHYRPWMYSNPRFLYNVSYEDLVTANLIGRMHLQLAKAPKIILERSFISGMIYASHKFLIERFNDWYWYPRLSWKDLLHDYFLQFSAEPILYIWLDVEWDAAIARSARLREHKQVTSEELFNNIRGSFREVFAEMHSLVPWPGAIKKLGLETSHMTKEETWESFKFLMEA